MNRVLSYVQALLILACIGTLMVIIMPAFVGDTKARYGVEAVKSNMLLLQTGIDIYGQKNKVFPNSMDEFVAHAKPEKYDKTMFNPFTYITGETEKREISFTLTAEEYESISETVKEPHYKGKVGYYRINPNIYAIYGFNKDGSYIKQDNKIFCVSNAK